MERCCNVFDILNLFADCADFRKDFCLPEDFKGFDQDYASGIFLNLFRKSSKKDTQNNTITVYTFELETDSAIFEGEVRGGGKTGNSTVYKFSFFRNSKEVFSIDIIANGQRELLEKRIHSSTNKNVALYSVFAVILAARYRIDFLDIGKNGVDAKLNSYEQFMNTAAEVEERLVTALWKDSKKSCRVSHYGNMMLRENLTMLINYSHIQAVMDFDCSSNVPSIPGWNVEVKGEGASKQELISKKAKKDELKCGIAKKVIESAGKYPIMDAIMQTRGNDVERITSIVNLLKQICRIRLDFSTRSPNMKNVGITVEIKPIIDSTLEGLGKIREVLYDDAREFTAYDVFQFTGKLAGAISEKGAAEADPEREHRYSFDHGELEEFLNHGSPSAGDMFEILKKPEIGIIMEEHGMYKFKYKQQRLIYRGVYDALRDNDLEDAITAWDLLSRVRENAEENRKTSQHFLWRHDACTFYGTAYLMALNQNKRNRILRGLCKIASDAAIDKRVNQEKAIALLSFYLCEGGRCTGQQREEIFRAAYGRDLYPVQTVIWEYLKKDSYYRNMIVNNLQNACRLEKNVDGSVYGTQDPLFLFLGWDSGWTWKEGEDAVKYFMEACGIQHSSWYGDHKKLNVDVIPDYVREAVTKLESGEACDKILCYVYGLSLILLALANVWIRKSDFGTGIVTRAEILIRENSGLMLKAAVLCDHAVRKYNRLYNEEPSDSWNLCLTLPSGPVRFLTSYSGCITPEDRLELDKTRRDDYRCWYKKESGRWKLLMARLLSFTDFFIDGDEMFPDKQDYCTKDQLTYDGLWGSWEEYIKELESRSFTKQK